MFVNNLSSACLNIELGITTTATMTLKSYKNLSSLKPEQCSLLNEKALGYTLCFIS